MFPSKTRSQPQFQALAIAFTSTDASAKSLNAPSRSTTRAFTLASTLQRDRTAFVPTIRIDPVYVLFPGQNLPTSQTYAFRRKSGRRGRGMGRCDCLLLLLYMASGGSAIGLKAIIENSPRKNCHSGGAISVIHSDGVGPIRENELSPISTVHERVDARTIWGLRA
jgi:hypothetical protein